jgi:hypothetical protein
MIAVILNNETIQMVPAGFLSINDKIISYID